MAVTLLAAELFDERQCTLGEGPVSSGPAHTHVEWVDIEGKKVLSRNIETGQSSEYAVPELVGFVIPAESGKSLLGTTSGPVLYDGNSFSAYASRNESDVTPMRWNDAKVAPTGDLFLGSMAYEDQSNEGAFYRLSKDGKKLTRLLDRKSVV